jgi:hypothetical protein
MYGDGHEAIEKYSPEDEVDVSESSGNSVLGGRGPDSTRLVWATQCSGLTTLT